MLLESEGFVGHSESDVLGLRLPRYVGKLSRSRELLPDRSQPPGAVWPMQFGWWVLRQLQTELCPAPICQAVRLDGGLDYSALAKAFRVLVINNETLRMRFLLTGEGLHSTVAPPQSFPLELVDLGGLAAPCRESEVRRIARALCACRLDLEHGPLVRAVLVKLHSGRNVLLLLLDRIVADRWAVTLICSELFRLYALSPGARNEPSAWSAWRHDFAPAEETPELREIRCGVPDQAHAPKPGAAFEGRRRENSACSPVRVDFRLSAAASALVHRTATQLREHPAGVLLACFYLLLSRLSLSKEVSVGVEAHNRSLKSARFIGPLACTVPVSVSLSDDPAFVTLVQRVSRACSEASDLTATSLDRLFDSVATRLASCQPAFQATFEFIEIVPETLRCPCLRVGSFPTPRVVTESDLDVRVTSQSSLFQCAITCDHSYREIIGSIAHAFQTLVLQTCGRPNCKASEYALLTDSERAEPVANRGFTESPGSFDNALDEIDRRALERPDAVAAVCGNDHVSYGCLNVRSNRLAFTLQRLNVKPESCVAALAPRDATTLVGMLGILKANAVYLPLDPAYPDSQIALMLEDSSSSLLLRRASFARRRSGYAVPILDIEETLAAADEGNWPRPTRGPHPDQAAYIMYTSGSTGKPKGVMVSHRGMSGHVLAKASDLNLGVTDIVAQTASCSFDISVWQFLSPLVAGGTVAIIEEDVATDPILLLDRLRRMDVTVWETVPVLMGIIVDEERRLAGKHERLPAMRRLISNAEALPTDLAARWQDLHPHARLLNTYGATEASDDVTHYWAPPKYKSEAVHLPLGTPIADGSIHVLDEHMRPVACGFPGEVYLGGPGVARGYVNQPALTSERFVPDPFSARPGKRLYRTGDLARWMPNGDLDFLGRVDDQTKVRGHRVEPDHIASIIRSHPSVLQAAVISLRPTNSESALAGFVVRREGAAGDLEDIRDFLKSNLPSYMIPASVIECPELPVNQNGKLDRKLLATMASGHTYIAPRTLTETVLAEILSETLEVPKIGARDDFFACGGTARRAVLLIIRIRSVMETEVPLNLVYTAGTVEAIAQYIDRKNKMAEIPDFEAGLTEGELRSLLSDGLDWHG